jgi:nucleotide-binding universal stress UspA family protein
MTNGTGRVVVGTDGSPGGRAALAFALHDAARRGAGVEVVTAFETAETLAALCGAPISSIGSTARIHDAVLRETSRLVDDVSAEVAGELTHLPAVTVTAIGGGAAEVLTRAGHDADLLVVGSRGLLVVGSRGRGGFASMVLGSVGLQCVLHASCPVTVVHPPAIPGDGNP